MNKRHTVLLSHKISAARVVDVLIKKKRKPPLEHISEKMVIFYSDRKYGIKCAMKSERHVVPYGFPSRTFS